MSTIPKDEIKKIAEERYPDNHANSILGNNVRQMRRCFIEGYQLATDGREELEKEIVELKRSILAGLKKEGELQSLVEYKDKVIEQRNNEIIRINQEITALQSQCTEKDQEIETKTNYYEDKYEMLIRIQAEKEKECEELMQELKAKYFFTESLYREIEELKAENERLRDQLK